MNPPRLRLVEPLKPVPEDSLAPRAEPPAKAEPRARPTAVRSADAPESDASPPVLEDSLLAPSRSEPPVLEDSLLAPIPSEPRPPVLADSLLAPSRSETRPPVLADSLLAPTRSEPPPPVHEDNLLAPSRSEPPVLEDSLLAPTRSEPRPPVLRDSLFPADGSEPPRRDGLFFVTPAGSPRPVPEDIPPADALAELDRLLTDPDPPDDAACARLARLAVQVPGRQRQVTAALARGAGSAAIAALRELPPAAPGLLAALIACFARGAPRLAPRPGDPPAPLLALEFRGSRARGFPDLVARAQAIAQASSAAELAAFDLDGRRQYRLTFWPDRCPTLALAGQLRAASLDLAWLHGRLVRLRGSRLWLAGWRFDADDPLGPAAQGRLLQVWLHGWLQRVQGPTA